MPECAMKFPFIEGAPQDNMSHYLAVLATQPVYLALQFCYSSLLCPLALLLKLKMDNIDSDSLNIKTSQITQRLYSCEVYACKLSFLYVP